MNEKRFVERDKSGKVKPHNYLVLGGGHIGNFSCSSVEISSEYPTYFA